MKLLHLQFSLSKTPLFKQTLCSTYKLYIKFKLENSKIRQVLWEGNLRTTSTAQIRSFFIKKTELVIISSIELLGKKLLQFYFAKIPQNPGLSDFFSTFYRNFMGKFSSEFNEKEISESLANEQFRVLVKKKPN